MQHRFCVAPMIDWTDRHFRFFVRLLSRHAVLYTEMVTTGALLHGPRDRLLEYSKEELPLAIQLGGSDPVDLAQAAAIAEDAGYMEVNLNVGCPSDRVQNGRFGACLMAQPERVAECIAAMQNAVSIPVTVKCRIGIDNQDSFEQFIHFVDQVRMGGCATFIVHARKAWLSGLSPKENRTIPPLHYDYVFDLKKHFPELEIILNGGITSLDWASGLIEQGKIDGVMLGREVYHNSFITAGVDPIFFGVPAPVDSRYQLIERFSPYLEAQLSSGVPLKAMTRHLLGLFQHQYGGKRWRRYLSEQAHKHCVGKDSNAAALAMVSSALELTKKQC